MLAIKRENGISLVALGFWILAVLIFCNVNGITWLLTGTLGLVSPFLIVFCFIIFLFLKVRKSDFSKASWFFIMSIFCLFALSILPAIYFYGYSNFQPAYLPRAFREAVTSIMIFSVFYLVYKNQDLDNQIKFFKIIFLLFLFTTIIGALEPVLGIRDLYAYDRSLSRALGFFGNPNETGLQACFTMVMALGLYMMNRLRLIFALPIVLVSIFTAISSFSKTAMLNLLLIISFYIVYSMFYGPFNMPKKVNRKNYLLVGVVLAFGLLIVKPNLEGYYNSLDRAQKLRIENFSSIILKGELTEKTTSERSGIFAEVFSHISRNPFFGYGTSTFSRGGMFKFNPNVGAHNLYIRLYLESGLITLLLFFAFIYYAFMDTRYLNNGGLFFLINGCVVVYLVFCFTDHNGLNQKLSIALLGVLLAINHRAKIGKA